jgi:hypothetical protein
MGNPQDCKSHYHPRPASGIILTSFAKELVFDVYFRFFLVFHCPWIYVKRSYPPGFATAQGCDGARVSVNHPLLFFSFLDVKCDGAKTSSGPSFLL